jgi:hypothetical protein
MEGVKNMAFFDDLTYNGKNYQTKDLGCSMEQYKIENNRLYRQKFRIEENPKNHDFSYPPNGVVKFQYVKDGWEDQEYHGYIYARELTFKFTDGLLVEVIDNLKEQNAGN